MNIGTFLELPQITDYPLSSPYYLQSYKELSEEITSRGESFYIVRHQSTYEGKGYFSKSWQFQGNHLIETGEIRADVVYDKGKFIDDGAVKVLNCKYVNDVCTDKWLMYEKFTSFCPFTCKVNNLDELKEKAKEIHTSLAVIKPIDGEEGKDVSIDTIQSLLQKTYVFPLLLQEFIDTSYGIPGIMSGLHDFRIVILNGEIINAYYRTPPQGSYLANVARGGSQVTVKVTNIPESIKRIALTIDDQLQKCGDRFYGIDFGFTEVGPKIIEMNSRLGLDNSSYGNEYVGVMKKLATALVQMCYKT